MVRRPLRGMSWLELVVVVLLEAWESQAVLLEWLLTEQERRAVVGEAVVEEELEEEEGAGALRL